MLSDIISVSEASMRDYLSTSPQVYEWLRPRIDALLREMGRVRSMLDIAGTPLDSVWVHVRPIKLLLKQEPLDHEQLNTLIDPILDQGPPNKKQEKKWTKLMVQANKSAK